MATLKRKRGGLDLRPFLKMVGLAKFIEQIGLGELIEFVGPEKIINALGPRKFIEAIGIDQIVAHLSAEQRQQLIKLLSASRSADERPPVKDLLG